MSWMSPNMNMKTSTRGGLGKALGRAFSGESMFLNTYTATNGPGMIAFASSFPGSIVPYEVSLGNEIVVQKRAFLASESGVDISIFFQKNIGSGLFGGEGFIMQKLSGEGTAFLEVDGSIQAYNLEKGQEIIVDTGCLAAMSDTCSIDIKRIKGAKNVFFGGEGFFNTSITGPGKVYLQTMPISKLVGLFNTGDSNK